MSSNPNRTSLFAIVMLLTAVTISVSAQSAALPSAAASTQSNAIRETRETDADKKPVSLAEDTVVTTGPEEVSELNPLSQASDSPRAGTKLAAATAKEAANEAAASTRNKSSATPQPASTDGWHFQLTPYLWLPTISGRAGIGNLITDTSLNVGDSDVELNFGFMSTFEARKNKFIILTDLQYSDLSTERGNPGPLFSSSRGSFKTFVLDPEVGYRLLDNGEGATLDVLGGIRYWHLNATLALRAGILPATEASRSRSWVDGVVGLRGRAALSKRFFLTGKGDLGGGGSNFTYQLFGGVGFGLTERFALIGGYRDLNVNYNKDGFLFDMSLHGPLVGLGIKF